MSHSKNEQPEAVPNINYVTIAPGQGGIMWRKPMSKQHKPSRAVGRTSRLFGTGLSPGFVLIATIAIKNKTNDCNEAKPDKN